MNNHYPAVELVNVSKRFVDFTAVNDISLQIEAGEFFSMLGPSGCGKTTTLRMIAGFEQISSGTLRLLSQDVRNQPPHRRNVNTVFQNYALFPHLTVFDNVAFGLAVKGIPSKEIVKRVTETLEMLRLTGFEKRKPAQLSGGQQQRVALGRAVVNRPGLLLLDEPLGALDQKLRKDMQLELKHLQRDLGITFIYVTHDQEEALTMSDRIAIMNQGRVLQVDEPRHLYERPAVRFVADFIGISNFLEGRFVGQTNKMATVEVDGLGLVRANPIQSISPQQAVVVAVRPERIHWLTEAPTETYNQVQGRIEEIVFVGNDTHYFLRLSNGQRMMLREQNQMPLQNGRQVRLGDEVTVGWLPASTNILLE